MNEGVLQYIPLELQKTMTWLQDQMEMRLPDLQIDLRGGMSVSAFDFSARHDEVRGVARLEITASGVCVVSNPRLLPAHLHDPDIVCQTLRASECPWYRFLLIGNRKYDIEQGWVQIDQDIVDRVSAWGRARVTFS